MARRNEEFGAAVRRVLEERSLTLRGQRNRTGINHVTASNMAQGWVPEMESVIRFAQGFGLNVNEWLMLAGYDAISADEHAADEEWKRGVAALEAEFGVFVVGSTEVYKDRRTVEAARRDLDTLRKALEGRRNVGGSGSASGESGGGSSRLDGPGGAGSLAGAPRYPGRGIRQPQPVPAAP